MNTVTCIAPVNIAVIKYWGKRDERLILPTNDSISATLDTDHMHAKTTVMVDQNFKEDRIWLNGEEQDIGNPRLQNCLTEIRRRATNPNVNREWKVHICSENNFPTAAGLASSAAGYACLVLALAEVFQAEGDVSSIARVGSGSACRSVLGGFVKWCMGSQPDGTDSIAKQIAPANHWPEMGVLIIVVNDAKKKVSSANGMKRTLETSDLAKYRIKEVLPERVQKMQMAILKKDFKTFAELTMKDSNQLHAICLDSYPPFMYMNEVSYAIINIIHAYNEIINETKVAYTFDAGPNATLYLLEENIPEFMGVLHYFFPILKAESLLQSAYHKGLPITKVEYSYELCKNIEQHVKIQSPDSIKYIIHTKVGSGPKYLKNPKDHLLNEQGLPISE